MLILRPVKTHKKKAAKTDMVHSAENENELSTAL